MIPKQVARDKGFSSLFFSLNFLQIRNNFSEVVHLFHIKLKQFD